VITEAFKCLVCNEIFITKGLLNYKVTLEHTKRLMDHIDLHHGETRKTLEKLQMRVYFMGVVGK